MNERINKLAEQAGLNAFPPVMAYDRKETHWTGWDGNLEKFAELIVRECMTLCADNACCAGGLNTQVGEDLYLASDLIKQHFGVEE